MVCQKANEILHVALIIHGVLERIAELGGGSIEQVVISSRGVWKPHALRNHHRPPVRGRLVVRVPKVLHRSGVVVHAAISRIIMSRNTDVRAGERILSPTVRLALPSQAANPDAIVRAGGSNGIDHGLHEITEGVKVASAD